MYTSIIAAFVVFILDVREMEKSKNIKAPQPNGFCGKHIHSIYMLEGLTLPTEG